MRYCVESREAKESLVRCSSSRATRCEATPPNPLRPVGAAGQAEGGACRAGTADDEEMKRLSAWTRQPITWAPTLTSLASPPLRLLHIQSQTPLEWV